MSCVRCTVDGPTPRPSLPVIGAGPNQRPGRSRSRRQADGSVPCVARGAGSQRGAGSDLTFEHGQRLGIGLIYAAQMAAICAFVILEKK
ncbi:hypothetical protein ACCAA_270115 [Candidatus Accumulibacter aalborgensis]|uniref:Uncharacterized protein n=1 Tax=Candidatus Accumulibacter aalborgensis TaxID=1860102 RepID=A0A1A8XPL9_9PROT|nr:hypothetical protein ACCAA_270115 [Candidatus Accumulibacter aalborgensis]